MIKSNELFYFIKKYMFMNDSSMFTVENANAMQNVQNVSIEWHPQQSQLCDIVINNGQDKICATKICGFHNTEHALFDMIISNISTYNSSPGFTGKELEAIGEHLQVSSIVNFILSDMQQRCQRPNANHDPHVLHKTIEILNRWSSQTYEGNRISFAIGFDYSTQDTSGVYIDKYYSEDFLKVITSGSDTMICCNKHGQVLEHMILRPSVDSELLNCPIQFGGISFWTSGYKVSAVLNRHGEILIFYNKELLFAKRRGGWLLFLHKQNASRLGETTQGFDIPTRNAIYQTALDVSFRRTGGCIGFSNAQDDAAIPRGEELTGACIRSSFLSQLVKGQKFSALPRLLRAELVSIDGATVIDNYGTIKAIGAILSINNTGGISGGGRTVAAKNLAQFGVGIKISNDGKIQAWRVNAETTPVVEVG